MRYFVPDRSLYTGQGELIKKLECPKRKRWADLQQVGSEAQRSCDQCNRTVYDSAELSEGDLLELLKRDPGACLKVSAHQQNIEVVARAPVCEAENIARRLIP